MSALRWWLLGFGVVVIAATYFYTRYRSSIRGKISLLSERREPRIGASPADDDVPVSEPVVEIESTPSVQKVVTVRMMARDDVGFEAERLILALRDAGLRHGQFGIFHRVDEEQPEIVPDFSVASLVEPGTFDLTRIKTDHYPGVSIFMELPGPRDGVEIFDDMLETSRALAKKMDGELRDEHGSTLSVQRERYIREEVIQFEHDGLRG